MLSIIMVDYCSLERTFSCIENFTSNIEDISKHHIIIVDNSPREMLDDVIPSKYVCIKSLEYGNKYIRFFESERAVIAYYYADDNLGYAKGNNVGVDIANRFFDDEYLLISNNDLIIPKTFSWWEIQKIFDSFSDVAIIGPRIIGLDGGTQSPHKRISAFKYLFMYYWIKARTFEKYGDLDYDERSKYCYRVMGSFMFVRKNMFLQVNGFDENTFLYAEEMILSERLLAFNYKNYFLNDFTVIHGHDIDTSNKQKLIAGKKHMFNSCCYYFKEYRNTPSLLIQLAKVNFEIALLIRKIYWYLDEKVKGGK